MIRQPYKNVFLQLRDLLLSEIDNKMKREPQAIPCRVVKKTGATVTVVPIIDLGATPQPITNVPICKPRCFTFPLAAGDIGLLIPASFIYDQVVLNDVKLITEPKRASTLGGYIFLPLAAVSGTNPDYEVAGHTKQGEVSALYSPGGQSFVGVWDGDIILLSNEPISFNKLKTWLDNFQANYNANVSLINSNNNAIKGGFLSCSPPVTVTLQNLNSFNDSYR